MFRYARGALRSLLPVAVVLLLVGAIAVPLAGSSVLRFGMGELDQQAELLGQALEPALIQWSAAAADGDGVRERAAIAAALERQVRDDRVYALALCDAQGRFIAGTPRFPKTLACPVRVADAGAPAGSGTRAGAGAAAGAGTPTGAAVAGAAGATGAAGAAGSAGAAATAAADARDDGRGVAVRLDRVVVHVARVDVDAASAGGRTGTLLVVRDMRRVLARADQARWIVASLLCLFAASLLAVSLIVARQSWRSFVDAVRQILPGSVQPDAARSGAVDRDPAGSAERIQADRAPAERTQIEGGRPERTQPQSGSPERTPALPADASKPAASTPAATDSARRAPAGAPRPSAAEAAAAEAAAEVVAAAAPAAQRRRLLGMMPELRPLARDLQRILRDVEREQRAASAVGGTDWSPATLRELLQRNFPGDEVIVLSNREPYVHRRQDDGALIVHRPAGGLVTAVEPVMRATSGTWIAHGSGNGDRDAVDANDRVAVPPDAPAYTLRRIWLSEQEEQGYYYGFANEGLWPLCHVAHVRPVFRTSDWEQYCLVNERFADAVVQEARTPDPIVLVQDYHFAMAPKMIRERLPDATIITFWHIPWPNFESFGICPWKEELLEGLLGSDILGFHTPYHCANFLQTVDRYLEARIERESDTISFGGRLTQVNAYPISIAWPEPLDPARFPALRHDVRAQYGLPDGHRLAVGVDRLDYTKGMVERFRAVDRLLELHPEWIGRVTLVQIAAPSRSSLAEYQRFDADVRSLAEQINAKYATQHAPIELRVEHHDFDAVQRHYRAADLCMVTSLHDGMNLVSKEFVAAHDDERGVLILSRFAGASAELIDALIVNPYHVDEIAEALHEALSMDEQEQALRMRNLRQNVRDFNVFRWAGRLLIDAGKLRRRVRTDTRLRSIQATVPDGPAEAA